MDFNRNRTITNIFLVAVLVTFLISVLINTDGSKLRLIARSVNATLIASSVYILLFGLYCRSSFFWKFLAIYSMCGFLVLFVSYWAYSRGEVPVNSIISASFVDYLDYLKACLVLILGLAVPLRYISSKTN